VAGDYKTWARPVAEENVYRVWLLRDGAVVSDGFHIYRGEQLPEPDDLITIEVRSAPSRQPALPRSRVEARLE